MTSYQVMCSVTRPLDPISLCRVTQLQDKAQRHLDAIFQDVPLSCESGSSGSVDDEGGPSTEASPVREDNLLVCAVVSKTSALFSGADSFQSRVKLRFFWCNLCPFDTESKAGMLQHIVSQHCFVCRFCPYVALSRCEVMQHGMSQHPQFLQQFREQRLKTCRLKRDMFQLHFNPQSDPYQPRKRAGQAGGGEEDEGPTPAKLCRGDSDSRDQEMKTEQQEEEQSSSSESLDELPLHFTTRDHGEASTSQALPRLAGVAGLTTGVMENIVSSSGMEPDIGAEKAAAAGSESTGTPQGPVPVQVRTPRAETPTGEDAPSVAVKQESDFMDADFAHALERHHASNIGQISAEQEKVEKNNTAGCSTLEETPDVDIWVKQEAEDTSPEICNMAVASAENLCVQDAQRGVQSSRPTTTSPPLTHIRVETLQRQFEESFGAHLSSSVSSLGLDSGQPQPQPNKLISNQRRQHQPEMVENFLIDAHPSDLSESQPLPEEGQGLSAQSMLRHLLTRPRRRAKESQEESVPAGPGRRDSDVEIPLASGQDGQSGRTTRGPESIKELNTSTHTHKRHAENFLLTPGAEENRDGSSVTALEAEMSKSSGFRFHVAQSSTPSPEHPSPFIKPEPEDNVDDYSSALVASLSSSHQETVQQNSYFHDRDKHVLASDALLPNRESVVQTSGADPVSKRLEKQQVMSPSLRNSQQASTSVLVMSPAEKLKSYSNMSLRDLLTMRTEVNHGTLTEQTMSGARSSIEGDVVWECSFCHFEDRRKSVVLAHRQQCHAKHMEEAGLGDEDADNWAGSSADGEEQDFEGDFGEENDIPLSQPSTSDESSKVLRQLSSQSLPSQQCHTSQTKGDNRSTRVRGFRRDDDFQYLSEDTMGSTSGSEPEDIGDKNYVPPKNLTLLEVLSSEDEEELEEGMKFRKGSAGAKKRRGRPSGVKTCSKVQQENKKQQEESEELIKHPDMLYLCPYCDHPPASEQVLKDHIRHTESSSHLLIIRRVLLPESVHYVCPGNNCAKVSSFDAQDCRHYLVHVLQCQGHILDAHKPSVHTTALTSLEKVGRVAGFLNCPISNCYFVSYFKEQMRMHLDSHIQRLHHSQMLLFRSVCTVMAKSYANVAGFDRYICYRCSSIMVDIGQVVKHMQVEHEGRVRGVLHVTQRLEGKSRGILVAVQCLKCLQRVPSLDQWFGHQCQPLGHDPSSEAAAGVLSGSSGLGSMAAGTYKPLPCVPPFDEWLWRLSSINIKATPVVPASKSETGSSTPHQLPLIRSILMQPTPASQKQASGGGTPQSDRVTCQRGSLQNNPSRDDNDDDDMAPMIECEDCQEFVLETTWKQHKCFVEAQKNLSQDSRKTGKVMHKGIPSTASTASTSAEDMSASHSKLLAALATRHQVDPPASTSVSASLPPTLNPRPGLTSSSHPSLVSLLTRASGKASQGQPVTPKSKPEEPQQSRETQPSHRDGGMIRSLLSRSLIDPKSKKEILEKGSPQATLTLKALRRDTDFSSRPREATDSSPAILQRATAEQAAQLGGTEPGSQWPGPAASILQNLAGERSGASRTASTGSSPASSQPPLMNFLRQQGNHVMQVLGNVLDDQDSSS